MYIYICIYHIYIYHTYIYIYIMYIYISYIYISYTNGDILYNWGSRDPDLGGKNCECGLVIQDDWMMQGATPILRNLWKHPNSHE